MAKVNIVAELSANHSDEEIIEYLDTLATGVLKNYRVSLEKGQPEILWGNLGDITLIATIIRELKKRNVARQSQNEVL